MPKYGNINSMITNNQLKSLSDEELGYLVLAINTEWKSLNMPYDLNMQLIKSIRADAITPILNKYSSSLKEEHKNIVLDILNKLEENK